MTMISQNSVFRKKKNKNFNIELNHNSQFTIHNSKFLFHSTNYLNGIQNIRK